MYESRGTGTYSDDSDSESEISSLFAAASADVDGAADTAAAAAAAMQSERAAMNEYSQCSNIRFNYCCCAACDGSTTPEIREQYRQEWNELVRGNSSRTAKLADRRNGIVEVFPQHIKAQNLTVVRQERENFQLNLQSVSIWTEWKWYILIIGGVMLCVIGSMGIGLSQSKIAYTLVVNFLWYWSFSLSSVYPFLQLCLEHFANDGGGVVDDCGGVDDDGGGGGGEEEDVDDSKDSFLVMGSDLKSTSRLEWIVATSTRVYVLMAAMITFVIVTDTVLVVGGNSPSIGSSTSIEGGGTGLQLAFIGNHVFFQTMFLLFIPLLLFRRVNMVDERRWKRIHQRTAAASGDGEDSEQRQRQHPPPLVSSRSLSASQLGSIGAQQPHRLRFLALPPAMRTKNGTRRHMPDSPYSSGISSRRRIGRFEMGFNEASATAAAAVSTTGDDSQQQKSKASPAPHHRKSKTEIAIPTWEIASLKRVVNNVPNHEYMTEAADGIRQVMYEKRAALDERAREDELHASIFKAGNLVQSAERAIIQLFYGKNSLVKTERATPIMICVAILFGAAYLVMQWFGKMEISLPVGVSLFFIVLIMMFFYEHHKHQYIFYDNGYLLFYSTVMCHAPIVIGPFIVSIVQLTNQNDSIWSVLITLLFALLLHLYLYSTEWISSMMSGPSIYSRFLFVSQIFRHSFWYVIFGLTPFGIQFFIMVFLVNVLLIVDHGPIGIRFRRYLKRLINIYLKPALATATTTTTANPPPPPQPPPPPTTPPPPSPSPHIIIDDDDLVDQASMKSMIDAVRQHHPSRRSSSSSSRQLQQHHHSQSYSPPSLVSIPSPIIPFRIHKGGAAAGEQRVGRSIPVLKLPKLPNQPMLESTSTSSSSVAATTEVKVTPSATAVAAAVAKAAVANAAVVANEDDGISIRDNDDNVDTAAAAADPTTHPHHRYHVSSTPILHDISTHHGRSRSELINQKFSAQQPQMMLPKNASLLPESSSEYEMSYNNYQSKILDIIFETRVIGQDLLADFIAICNTPILVWLILTYGSEATKSAFEFSSERLWTKFAIIILVRCITLYIVRNVVNRRTSLAKKKLLTWSIFGVYHHDISKVMSRVTMHNIQLGMDARLHRNAATAISTYLQNRNVCLEDVELFIERHLRDINLPIADMAFSNISALHYTVSNLRNCFGYFIVISVMVFFSVLGSFEQKNQWSFWKL